MRTTNRKRLADEQRKATKRKRLAGRKVRQEARAAQRQANDIARKQEHSPEGKRAAEILTENRQILRKKEQANYQKTRARAATRMGGRRKQIQAELRTRQRSET